MFTFSDPLPSEQDEVKQMAQKYLDKLASLTKPQNFDPCTKVSDQEYVEGYWWDDSADNAKFPFPRESDGPVDARFLERLHDVTGTLAEKQFFFGGSLCRLCGKGVGGIEYSINGNGIRFRYPDGIFHYYQSHHVQPSLRFREFILRFPVTLQSKACWCAGLDCKETGLSTTGGEHYHCITVNGGKSQEELRWATYYSDSKGTGKDKPKEEPGHIHTRTFALDQSPTRQQAASAPEVVPSISVLPCS